MKSTTIAPFVTQPASRKPIGRPCLGRVAMTDAERSRRYRKLAKKRRRARNFEWYTPRSLIELAVEVMGGIDCDPASCTLANQVVGAKVFYGLHADGLKQAGHGKVWLNPPYAAISLVVAKPIDEMESGRVTEAIVLTANSSDSAWFQRAATFATSICLPARRIKFVSPHGLAPAFPPTGQAVFLWRPSRRAVS